MGRFPFDYIILCLCVNQESPGVHLIFTFPRYTVPGKTAAIVNAKQQSPLPQSRCIPVFVAFAAFYSRNQGKTGHEGKSRSFFRKNFSLSLKSPRVCFNTGEMSDFCPKTRAFKEKTARKACRLSRMFDAESTVLGQNRRRFGVFKQTLEPLENRLWLYLTKTRFFVIL